MNRQSRLIKPFPLPLRVPHLQINMNVNLNFSLDTWQAPLSVQHSFINQIREIVSKYCLQSAAHFSTTIEVCQAVHTDNPERFANVDRDFMLWVGFYNFGDGPHITACRPKAQRCGRKNLKALEEEVEVYMKMEDKFVPLRRFLKHLFPKYDGLVGDQAMSRWWGTNGHAFDWKQLPTELKERIVQFCMHRSPPSRISNKSKGRKAAPEVTGQFSEWASLLRVSHQVRAICLRLCFVGSSGVAFSNGLCIVAKDLYSFQRCIRRLSKHFQMTEPNGAPNEDKIWELAKTYKLFPKIYPRLSRYATFCHGIRRMHLQFSFLDSLHFFKVTAGSFSQRWKSYHLDYQVFERLPHLNELIIKLPDATGRLEDNSKQPARLFYGEPFNCPRVLHRLIYENAAEALAHIENVKMEGFIDDEEMVKFFELLEHAKRGMKITTKELEELYMEDTGGVELENNVESDVEKKDVDTKKRETVHDGFWPPKCRCEVLCRDVVHPRSI